MGGTSTGTSAYSLSGSTGDMSGTTAQYCQLSSSYLLDNSDSFAMKVFFIYFYDPTAEIQHILDHTLVLLTNIQNTGI